MKIHESIQQVAIYNPLLLGTSDGLHWCQPMLQGCHKLLDDIHISFMPKWKPESRSKCRSPQFKSQHSGTSSLWQDRNQLSKQFGFGATCVFLLGGPWWQSSLPKLSNFVNCLGALYKFTQILYTQDICILSQNSIYYYLLDLLITPSWLVPGSG